MTRKHFELIARVLAKEKPILSEDEWHLAQYVQWEIIVESFANMCSDLNPRFNKNTFNKACGRTNQCQTFA